MLLEVPSLGSTNINEDSYDPNWSKDSLAVVISDGDAGWVMSWVGPHVQQSVDDYGSRDAEDLGCMPPGAGIWVWQGRLTGGRYIGFAEYEDTDLTGTFREPTAEEWHCIKNGLCPWDADDWVVNTSLAERVDEHF